MLANCLGVLPAMVSKQWGSCDEVKHLYTPNWNVVKSGDMTTLVVDVHCFRNDTLLAVTCPGKQLVRVSGSFPAGIQCGRLTLVNVRITSGLPIVGLCIESCSRIFGHQPLTFAQTTGMIEVCSGLAAASMGFVRCGFQHLASVEWQAALVGLHQCVHPAIPILHGDVKSDDILCQLWSDWHDHEWNFLSTVFLRWCTSRRK